jgi:hypothetical protein
VVKAESHLIVLGVAFARKTSWGGVKRGQRNGGAHLRQIAEALGMRLSEFFAEVESWQKQDE